MKLTYDSELNIAYIRFKRKSGQVRTIAVSDELNIDMAADGTIYGMELLNARAQLGANSKNNLVIENKTSGQSLSLAIG